MKSQSLLKTVMEKKTKANKAKTQRFLFYTGGTDSSLLLHYLTQLLIVNKNDNLVIVIVFNDKLGSSQGEKIPKALNQLISSFFSNDILNSSSVFDRISTLVIQENTIQSENLLFSYEEKKEKKQVSIKYAQQMPEMAKYSKSICGQELILLATIPSLATYLRCCKNKFYIGSCGSDLASNTLSQLHQIFNLYTDVLFGNNKESDLDIELSRSNLTPFSRNNAVYFNKDWIPTLNFPLSVLRKADVLMLLSHADIHNFIVDKPEDLLEFYSQADNFELINLTSAYHALISEHTGEDNLTSLISFIKTNQIQYTVNGEIKHIDSDLIENSINEAKLKFYSRAFGLNHDIVAQLLNS